ncbi:hypothetical protein [Coraliomargarita parva]|uniref:hypothetical protein n=1 Tax=Coraliomargarita parva TaxID=3014050 RepID=UPI0022B2D146|nr:hypothetical protein [Coraliomargarita parva]
MKRRKRHSLLAVIFLLLVALLPAQVESSANEVVSEEAISHPRVGVCVHLRRWENPEKILKMVSEAGISWVRMDFYWPHIEKEKGVYAMPEDYQTAIDEIAAAGLKLDAIFNNGRKGHPLYEPNAYDPEAFARAASWFAEAAKGKVHAIEVLNEPHNFGFAAYYGGHGWNGLDKNKEVEAWVGKYVEFLNITARRLKADHPELKVIGLGSVAPVIFRQLEMGIDPSVDGIAGHPYSFRMTAEYVPYPASDAILARDGILTADKQGSFASQLRMYGERSRQFDGPKEIWLTEWGWPTYQEKKAGSLYAGFTESAQAKYILRRLTETIALGVEVNMIYDFKNDGRDPYEAEDNFGLVDYDLNPKPAYYAVKNFCTVMSGFEPKQIPVEAFPVYTRSESQPIVWDGGKIQTTGQIRVYGFENAEGTPMIAYWSAERAGSDRKPIMGDLEIRTEAPVHEILAYDLMTGESKALEFEVKGQRIMIPDITFYDYPVALVLK